MFSGLKQRLNSFIGRVEESAEHEVKISAKSRLKSMVSPTVRLSEGDLEEALWELNLDLMQSDVAADTSEYLVESIKANILGKDIEKNRVSGIVKETLKDALTEILDKRGFNLVEEIRKSEKPYVIAFFGVNGTGKTTTIAKLARIMIDNGFSVALAAADTFRAGAIEQLNVHGERLGVKTISHQKGGDSAAVVYDAIEHAKARGVDVVLADTAGRMQTNRNLMDELSKVCRVNKPNLKVFVGDSLTGNDAVEQAKAFNEAVGIDASILTKMDADSRGGAAISIAHETGKPIIYVGVGQDYKDLNEFEPDWFIKQLL
ncbi:MAG TPA: signal recognition particle-docking protein FtsY [Candidatus Altiarchaeales archaeon]|nr:signal recognition particle-docking protein FtsY [Candidatus Altiarchaeales archaeon]